MQSLSEYNDGFNYLLTVINVFRKTCAQTLKRKRRVRLPKLFDTVLTHSEIPKKLQTAEGKEFFNKV